MVKVGDNMNGITLNIVYGMIILNLLIFMTQQLVCNHQILWYNLVWIINILWF
jgi:hypothetical protein